jgi:hypothetical protein
MTEITFNKNIYVYGKFYEEEKTNFPQDQDNYDVIIYPKVLSSRIISSLEGFFVADKPLVAETDHGVIKDWNPIIKRGEMPLFEEKYQGKFIPFRE